MCLYLDAINVLRSANEKINLKEEQKPVVKEMLFGSSGLQEMFLLFFRLAILKEFRKRSGRANSYRLCFGCLSSSRSHNLTPEEPLAGPISYVLIR